MAGVQEVIKVSKPTNWSAVTLNKTTRSFVSGDGGHYRRSWIGHRRRTLRHREREQAFAVAARVHLAGAQFFRGGAYKPRTSPYSFQGLGEEGLRIMADIRHQYGMKIITEAIDNESLDLVEEYADMIQIGARNMQNFSLLKRAGRAKKPFC